jgi:hypothetical protein
MKTAIGVTVHLMFSEEKKISSRKSKTSSGTVAQYNKRTALLPLEGLYVERGEMHFLACFSRGLASINNRQQAQRAALACSVALGGASSGNCAA